MRYDKGHKDMSRQHILAVATAHFRTAGIAGSGLSGIMSDAGLTNGAFYPHFKSKAVLVRDSLDSAIKAQCDQIGDLLVTGGPEMLIDAYLSAEHRDNPGAGCASAALLPEIAREPMETRAAYTQRQLELVDILAGALPAETANPKDLAISIFATLIGTLQLARAVSDPRVSDRVLAAGANAAKAMLQR